MDVKNDAALKLRVALNPHQRLPHIQMPDAIH
jgi:hypothetical protein